MFRKPIRVAAALTALALVAAACSSGSSSSSTTMPKFTGAPVVIGQIIPITGAALQLGQQAAADTAAINYYNQQGGLDGHKMVLDQCDSQDSATIETQCAQRLVNEHAIATLADSVNFAPDAVTAALTAAGIPEVGLLESAPSEYMSTDMYPIDPGMILMLAGMVTILIKHGCTNPALVTVDSPTAPQLPALIGPIAQTAGGKLGPLVLISGTATDYSQYVTAAQANGACGAALAVGTAQADAFITAAAQLNSSSKYSASSGTFGTTDLKKLPASITTKMRYTYGEPFGDDPGVPGLANEATIWKEGGSNITPANAQGAAVIPPVALHAMIVAAKSIGSAPVTAASFTAALKAATNINMWGITPNWNPGQPIKVAGPFAPLFGVNITNPMLWDEGWNGQHGTNDGQFNILADVPGSGVSASSK